MDLLQIKPLLEIIGLVITIFGVPVAIFLFFTEKRRERLDREHGTYSTLDDKYIEFLKICLEHSELGIYDTNDVKNQEFTNEQNTQRKIIFEILICLFERAFLMYHDQHDTIKKRQWSGWSSYMKNWMENEAFQILWIDFFNSQYDSKFLEYMNYLYGNSQNAINP
ncbi:MAG: hypothetical protein WBA61_08480 [Aequorivita sp.]